MSTCPILSSAVGTDAAALAGHVMYPCLICGGVGEIRQLAEGKQTYFTFFLVGFLLAYGTPWTHTILFAGVSPWRDNS